MGEGFILNEAPNYIKKNVSLVPSLRKLNNSTTRNSIISKTVDHSIQPSVSRKSKVLAHAGLA